MRSLLYRFATACLIAAAALSQTPSGEFTGLVTDSSGAAVSGAKVTITNAGTNAQRALETNNEGLYSAPALQPGVYNLRVEKQGFSTQVQNSVELQTAQVLSLNFSLKVGAVSETVEVQASAPVLESETTSVGTVIENKRIVELPLNGRNYLQLASLIPGATTNGPSSSQGQQRMGGARNSFALNVAGQRVHYNHYSLDGMENTDPNFNTYLFLPSIDALQEFKVESGMFPAEYGRAIAQVNATTKSGTNQFHMTAFEFLRNAKLDAKNFFDRADLPKPAFKRNQFGVTATGPIFKDKLFFMGNYEGLRERRALTITGTLPTAALRAGNIGSTIRDPFTRSTANPQGDPFPTTTVPASRVQANSARVLQEFYPLPNNPSATGLANNYLNNEGRRSDANQGSGRLDWIQSANSNFFFRFSQTLEPQYIPSSINGQGNSVDIYAQQGVLGWTRVIGANKVNEFKFGVNYFKSANIQTRAFQRNVVQELNIPDVSRDNPLYFGIPVFQISGFTNVGECNDCPFVNWNTTGMLTDNFSWTSGKHQWKFGGEFRRLRYNQIGAVVPRGRFSWNGQYSGSPMADYLLGTMSNTEGQVGAPIANMRNNYIALYLQDTWKLTPKLTVNYGIRWEYESPYADKHDAIVNIDFRWDNSMEPTYVRAGSGDPLQGKPLFPLPPDVKYVRDGRFGRGAYAPDRNDFGPRLGIAYQLNEKTVIRTGAGIYYVRDIGNAVFDIVRNAPFTIRRNEPANTVGVPNLGWQRPFTQLGAPTFILINQYGERTSYVGQWSFGVQRQLTRDMSLELTYMGSMGAKLRRLQTYNNAPPGVGNINERRPFPKFGGFQVMNAPGHASYNSFQARLQHRFAHGFTVLGSYAWGKSIDNGSGIRTTDGDPLTPSNDYDLAAERGLSAFDFRHRMTSSFLYELPFGAGRKHDLGKAGNLILGGWQTGGIVTFQTGFPLTAFCAPGNWQNGGGYCKPDPVPGQKPDLESGQTPNRFFNTNAFTNRIGFTTPAAVAAAGAFRYGFSGRNNFTGPSLASLDFSLNKTFRLTEKQQLEFRTEVFNFPNHPIFAPPGTTLGVANYGVIGATKVDSRQIQFALKYSF
ncbi:MAG: carboxypeptidase regulatory-like domain-containing protein [Acidobacteria bacterium]|nr:carboxypeptidase regulatory-like domain-containing protein [Acidobacteriota bacterium]